MGQGPPSTSTSQSSSTLQLPDAKKGPFGSRNVHATPSTASAQGKPGGQVQASQRLHQVPSLNQGRVRTASNHQQATGDGLQSSPGAEIRSPTFGGHPGGQQEATPNQQKSVNWIQGGAGRLLRSRAHGGAGPPGSDSSEPVGSETGAKQPAQTPGSSAHSGPATRSSPTEN